jgi:phage shock protein A
MITRLIRLFRADVNAVLDRFEEPIALLRQAILDMEEAVGNGEQRLQALAREQADTDAREAQLRQMLPAFEEELDFCFASGKDELARALVKRSLEAAHLADVLKRRSEALNAQIAALEARLRQNNDDLQRIRQKAEILGEAGDDRRFDDWSDPADSPLPQDAIEIAFLREKQRRAES